MEHSIYQLDIYDEITKGDSNVVIGAVAGSGKTTTIEHCISIIPKKDDSIYGKKSITININRHFLHAYRLKIVLPGEKEPGIFIAALPDELERALVFLRA